MAQKKRKIETKIKKRKNAEGFDETTNIKLKL